MQKKYMLDALISHYANGKKVDFAKKLGITPQAITTWYSRNTFDTSLIYAKCEDLDAHWLLTGEGEMLKSDTQAACPVPSGIRAGIPLIPFNAMAGALRGEQNAMDYECEHYVVPDFRNADFMMHISGDSMVPTFQSGDIVACQRVPMSGLFFQWNRPYILDTDQGAIIKRVKPGSDSSHVLIVSDNRDYDAFELEYSQIHAVALVLGIIRLE